MCKKCKKPIPWNQRENNFCSHSCATSYTNIKRGAILSILQIHHIDGDATNNKEQNLQVLCPNHHAMTEHFGSRNKNSTRKYRYKK